MPKVFPENLYGGAENFLNLPMVSDFTRKINAFISSLYNCILNLHFAMHYPNNPIFDVFSPKTATFLKATMNKKILSQFFFSLRCNLKGAIVLKFCPPLGAVKIVMLRGWNALAPVCYPPI